MKHLTDKESLTMRHGENQEPGKTSIKIGVLAIQGDFAAHIKMLNRIGVEAFEVRRADDLSQIDGLIIPGGESTTILKFLTNENLLEPIRLFAENGKPIFGTCAGAILLARDVLNPPQPSLGLLDITIERNAYGRQLDSHISEVETPLDGGAMEAVFIRAPRIKSIGKDVEALARIDAEPVFVRQGTILAATFHPELTNDERVHRYFVEKVLAAKASSSDQVKQRSTNAKTNLE
jgi:5'-phosphate synthase pdxT subunit